MHGTNNQGKKVENPHKIQNPGLFIALTLSSFTLLALAAYSLLSR